MRNISAFAGHNIFPCKYRCEAQLLDSNYIKGGRLWRGIITDLFRNLKQVENNYPIADSLSDSFIIKLFVVDFHLKKVLTKCWK